MTRKHTVLVFGMVLGGIIMAVLLHAPSPLAQAQDREQNRGEQVISSPRRQPAPAQTIRSISLDQAHAVLAAAAQKAADIDTKMNIAVVDAGGNLKAFARMDDAWLGSIDISIKKARTARSFDMPTGDIGKLSQPGKSLYMIEVSNDGLITFPGGVPIKDDEGHIIGAIGVSGSTVENDHTVAEAGAAAIGGQRRE